MFGAPLPLPAQADPGLGKNLRHRLHAQRPPSRFADLGDPLASLMQRIEIGADNIAVEDRLFALTQQHRNLAERVFGIDLVVAPRWARLVVDDFQPVGKADLVSKDKRLAGEGRVGLIVEDHGCLAGSGVNSCSREEILHRGR